MPFKPLSEQPMSSEVSPLLAKPPTSSVSWREIWRTILPYMAPDTKKLQVSAVLSFLFVMLAKVVALLPPLAYKHAVDQLIRDMTTHTAAVPFVPILVFSGAMALSSLFKLLRDCSYSIVASNCSERFNIAIFEHLEKQSLSFHLQRKTGEITNIISRGANSIDTISNAVLLTILPTVLEFVFVFIIFLTLGTGYIALTLFVTIALFAAYTINVASRRTSLRRQVCQASDRVSKKAVDNLLNFETVKMFSMETQEVASFARLEHNYQEKNITLRTSLSGLTLGQSIIRFLGSGTCMLLAAVEVAHGRLTVGGFVLINTFLVQLFTPLVMLGSTYTSLVQATTDLEKSAKLLKEPVLVQDRNNARSLKVLSEEFMVGRRGEVVFDNVSFRYQSGEREAGGGLQNISFVAQPGKMLAVVGASGIGKSTVMRLLLRFYDVNEGSVRIDSTDVRDISQASLRNDIGVVTQETVLFNTSLRENIVYGKPGASDGEIFQAARSAALGPLIDSLPTGLDTIVGERGVRLSGGERQRVGCARCLIRNPAIVLLDEATSALDTLTEKSVRANLWGMSRGRTTIAVAHRLSAVMMADEIIVLGKGVGSKGDDDGAVGCIIERGTHAELLERKGKYAKMWVEQTRNVHGSGT